MPVVETKGAASAQGLGEFAKTGVATYIEDVFSTYLYKGTAASLQITNNIDLSTKGGMVWVKGRNDTYNPYLMDTANGVTTGLSSAAVYALSGPLANYLITSYNTDGFTLGSNSATTNLSNINYVSWTFRKQPKFFDIVTYTGTGSNRTVAHNLGSVPGCIFVKRTDSSADWAVYHRSLANTEYLVLDSTAAKASGATYWNSTTATATDFSLGTATDVNANTGTYVAYLFAHNAGGFGLAGTDNVISCGSFTVSGNVASVNLGYEPQWLMIKKSDGSGNWGMKDVMRGGLGATSATTNVLYANDSAAEATSANWSEYITSTGFGVDGMVDATYIYIAIRRGPMKTPTDATKVFDIDYQSSWSANAVIQTPFPPDATINKATTLVLTPFTGARLTGSGYLQTAAQTAETSGGWAWDNPGGQMSLLNAYTDNPVIYTLQRAPGYFDVVCYTGAGGSSQTIDHNLGVAPEMIILKSRSNTSDWPVYHSGVPTPLVNNPALNLTGGYYANSYITPAPTSTQFVVNSFNVSTRTYIAYLFATLAGVSKVGSYTGNATLTTINCGFAAGARFVLIKRTDAAGDWFVWDSTRGMVAGTDPSLSLNTTSVQANANSVYSVTTGFQLLASPSADINTNGGTYIFLAIA